MVDRQTFVEIRKALEQAYGLRFRHAVLYGSEARGQADIDSDIDLMVVLDGAVSYFSDLHRSVAAVYPIEMRLGRAVSTKPVSWEQYSHEDSPLMRNVRREGITL